MALGCSEVPLIIIIKTQKIPAASSFVRLRQGIHSASFTFHHLRRDHHQDQDNCLQLQSVKDIPGRPRAFSSF
jgi:hypothetical protein